MVKKYDKLVRDKIPQIIEESGNSCVVKVLNDADYYKYLDAKLDEEVAEYRKDKNPEELADIMEIIYALASTLGCGEQELDSIRRNKAEKRGAFEKKLLLREVTEKE